MRILGIETSCDETGAAVVEDGRSILSTVVASSLAEHEAYGGIIPEIASRRQLEFIHSVVDAALREAGIGLRDIDAIGVTASPGLLGSLLVGVSFARALGFACERPVIEVDHIQAHVYANFLRGPADTRAMPGLPAVGLIVSGGHTNLYHIQGMTNFQLIGQTRDDAAGEAFDKVARILSLGYPGGPAIDRLARSHQKAPTVRFAAARLPDSYDFSFSGTKTAVLYHVNRPGYDPAQVSAVAHAFQESVVGVLTEKCLRACRDHGLRTLLVGGGVAANSRLRESLGEACEREGIALHVPPLTLCMDNAAMIAGYAYHAAGENRN